MKIIRYHLCTPICENGTWREELYEVEMPWSEQNERIAQREAHRGAYTVEEAGEVSA